MKMLKEKLEKEEKEKAEKLKLEEEKLKREKEQLEREEKVKAEKMGQEEEEKRKRAKEEKDKAEKLRLKEIKNKKEKGKFEKDEIEKMKLVEEKLEKEKEQLEREEKEKMQKEQTKVNKKEKDKSQKIKTKAEENLEINYEMQGKSQLDERILNLQKDENVKTEIAYISKDTEFVKEKRDITETKNLKVKNHESADKIISTFIKDSRPTFGTHLTDRTAAQGSRIKLTCTVLGFPEPTVEWLKNGDVLVPSSKYRTTYVDGLSSFELFNAEVSDSAEYACVAKNSNGASYTSSFLKIFESYEPTPLGPIFTRTIKDNYNVTANELVLECCVRGNPQPSLTWMKDNIPIHTGGKYQQMDFAQGKCKLIILNPTDSDSGNYTCRVENSNGFDQVSHYVHFTGKEKIPFHVESLYRNLGRPHFSHILSDEMVPDGGTIALQVEVKGTPSEVTWLRGTDAIRQDARYRHFREGSLYTLAISGATPNEAGPYTCRAWNAYGKVDTTAYVRIIGPGACRDGKPATIVHQPVKDVTVATGEDITVSLRVQGQPKPKVYLTKGLRDITTSMRIAKETSDDYIRFTIKRALDTDAGTYCIMAKNIYGVDRAFFTVMIRQRARSVTPPRGLALPDSLNLIYTKEVPGPIASEPVVTDSGTNWCSLSWPKPESQTVGGGPVLAYRVDRWELGTDGGARWAELGITPINCFDVFNLRPGAEYHFRITPRNRNGWGESVQTGYPITVGPSVNLPEFTKPLPCQIKVLCESEVVLECTLSDVKINTLVWYKDGIELDPGSSIRMKQEGMRCSLILSNVQNESSGRYMCEASNRTGKASTFVRLLVVDDPKILEADKKLKMNLQSEKEVSPQFTMRLRDRRVQMTYPVRLTCQIIGQPTPEITWSKDGETIISNENYSTLSDGTFKTLEISRAGIMDSGVYCVTAKNIFGSVSCCARLVVDKGIKAYIAPEFFTGLEAMCSVLEGDELKLSAQVEAYPSVGITWHRDGKKIRSSRRCEMTLDREGMLLLQVKGVTVADGGLYTCTARNEVGETKTSTRVIVVPSNENGEVVSGGVCEVPLPLTKKEPSEPRFKRKPTSTEAFEGDTVIIACEVAGEPRPEVYWLRDFLKPNYYLDAPHFRCVGEGPEYRLEIPCAKLDFTGTYSVVARNCHGECKAIMSLQIYAKDITKDDSRNKRSVKHSEEQRIPVLNRPLSDLRCCDGDSVTFECKIDVTPEPKVRWEKDGKMLSISGDFVASADGDGRFALTITRVYPEDEGCYSCTVLNDLGNVTTSACLVVDVPEEKENLLSRQLCRPPGFMPSNGSTPHSTPRGTPARSVSPMTGSLRNSSSMSLRRATNIRPSTAAIQRRADRLCTSGRPPKFLACPHNRLVEEGATVRFRCSVSGHPSPWTNWDKDGVPVTQTARIGITEEDDLRTLEIREVTNEDAGLYRIVIENDHGRVEATARLEVLKYRSAFRSVRSSSASPRASPFYSKRLQNTTVRVGTNLKLSTELRAYRGGESHWVHDGVILDPSNLNKRITILETNKSRTIIINKVKLEDCGEYVCVTSNNFGTASVGCHVAVEKNLSTRKRMPKFKKGLGKSITFLEGQMGFLMCQLEETDIPFTVKWTKDYKEIPDCDDYEYMDYGKGLLGLKLADVYLQDAGIYHCEVSTALGNIKTDIIIRVKEASSANRVCAEFEHIPVAQTSLEGRNVQFLVRANALVLDDKSNPNKQTDLVFKWFVAGRPVQDDGKNYVIETVDGESVLHVLNVNQTHSGEIRCTASAREAFVRSTEQNSGGKIRLYDVTCVSQLDVLPLLNNENVDGGNETIFETTETLLKSNMPSKILTKLTDQTVLRGNAVNLEIEYSGCPEPDVVWFKADRELKECCHTSLSKGKSANENYYSRLTLANVSDDDSSKYSVSVKNDLGCDFAHVSVAIEGVPRPPVEPPLVKLSGSDSVLVSWKTCPFDGRRRVTAFALEKREIPISKHDKNTNADWQSISPGNKNCNLELQRIVGGLVPGKSYQFRVRSVNDLGPGESGPTSDVILIPDVALGEMTNADAEKTVHIEKTLKYQDHYKICEELGRGRFGTVRKAENIKTGETVAIKIIRAVRSKEREITYHEISIMNKLNDENLLKLLAAYEANKEIVLITEFVSGGELFERVIADDYSLTEIDCAQFMKNICEGVSYMHKHRIVHLDLKPENIMCESRDPHSHNIKIIDFGLARQLSADGEPQRVLFGTPEFIPPEVINYDPISLQTDMWSIGVICYVLLSGLSPFMGDNDAETFANVTRAEYDFDDPVFLSVSQDALSFVTNLLIKQQEKRSSAQDCLNSQWLTKIVSQPAGLRLRTDRLKKFVIRRKWQKTGNAIRAIGRLSAVTPNNNSASEKDLTETEKSLQDAKINSTKAEMLIDKNIADVNKRASYQKNLHKHPTGKKKSESNNNKSIIASQRDACQSQSKSLQRATDKLEINNSNIEHDLKLDTRLEQAKKTLSNENVISSCTAGKNTHRSSQDSVRSRIRHLENSMKSGTHKNKHHSRSEYRHLPKH